MSSMHIGGLGEIGDLKGPTKSDRSRQVNNAKRKAPAEGSTAPPPPAEDGVMISSFLSRIREALIFQEKSFHMLRPCGNCMNTKLGA